MNKKIKNVFNCILQSLFISGVVIFVVCPLSCHISPQGIELVGGDYISPKIESYKIIDGKHINLKFSEDISLNSVVIENKNKDLISVKSIEKGKNIGELIVGLEKDTEIGCEYVMGGVVNDKYGNTLTFSLPFSGYNEKVPLLLISEVQTRYSKVSDLRYRCEFVKLHVLEDGNLFGLIIGSASNGKDLDYHFPPLEVKKNDIIVVHFRNKGEGCIDELGNDLDLSFAPNSCKIGRDLWLNNQGSAFSDSGDVIYLKNIITNKIMDGFMYSNQSKESWSSDSLEYAQKLCSAGIFSSSLITDAVNICGITPTSPFVCLNIKEIIYDFDQKKYNNYPIPNSQKQWNELKNDENITVK